jgi:hypothetical protein
MTRGKNSTVKRCVTVTICASKTDVLLLADVFESFRGATVSSPWLDPAYYVSRPQLSWDCLMKMTDCRLTLLSDPEMFNMIRANLRGGITMISKR